ncbi:MAG: site-2 protease family protein [Pseudomonadota bacterium]
MFANSVKLFSLCGFDLKIDPSWLLIAALITWSLAQGYFPSAVPGQTDQVYLVMALVSMLCFFASLVLHELAHSLVARQFDVPIKGITLFLFGGVAELGGNPKSATAEIWVALAGPIMSFCLAFVFWVLAKLSDLAFAFPHITEILIYLATINSVLALFNLLPAFPLDGGRVLRGYLWYRHGDILRATEAAAKSGTVFAYGLMALGVLALFQGVVLAGLWYVMIGGFLLVAARSSYQSQLSQTFFEDKCVCDLMNESPVVVDPAVTLAEFANRIMLPQRVTFVPVVEDGMLLGHMDQHVLTGIDRENWAETQVGDVFAEVGTARTVSPEMPVAELMQTIAETGQRKFLVTKGATLSGVITLADLTGYLRLADMIRHL